MSECKTAKAIEEGGRAMQDLCQSVRQLNAHTQHGPASMLMQDKAETSFVVFLVLFCCCF